MDKQELEQKFEEVYKTKIEPQLQSLEDYRLSAVKSFDRNIICTILLMFIAFCGLGFYIRSILNDKVEVYSVLVFFLFIVLVVVSIFLIIRAKIIYDEFKKYIKKSVLIHILSIFGEFKFYTEKRTTLHDIKGFGLYTAAERINYDDIFSGIYKNIPVSVEETELSHKVETKDSSYTVIDFKGLIFKIKMNKSFTCKVVAG